MEVLGRLPLNVFRPVEDLAAGKSDLARWRAGCIATADGRLVRIERRWIPYKASRLRVWWDRSRRKTSRIECELFFHHARGNGDFLVLGYVRSHRRASLASFYCATLVLDEIARIKRCGAIVADVTNDRLSDRLLERWGWQRHCHSWRGRHFIKRFYGTYPAVPAAWVSRIGAAAERL